MKMSAVFFCALFTASALFADVYSEALRQARNVGGDGNNETQNSRSPSAQPSSRATSPTDPVLEATLRNISNLRVDFDAFGKLTEIKPDSAQTKLLLNDLTAAAQSTKPPGNSVSKLAENLATAIAGKKSMEAQHQKLAQDVHAIFNSSHLSSQQQKMIFDDVRNILQDGGVSADETTNVVSEIQMIASQTK
jgi:hypothetical protein